MTANLRISARPHINGNSKADFYKAGETLLNAKDVIRAARDEVCGNIMHGRNYQHVKGWPDATRHREVTEAMHTFNRIMRDLDRILDGLIPATRD